ncbi:hypothetical protein D9E47_05790 [Escherichia coli]|nr:hypothetical protein [Escherichia coli]
MLNSVSKENGQSHKRQIENSDVIFFARLFMVLVSYFLILDEAIFHYKICIYDYFVRTYS